MKSDATNRQLNDYAIGLFLQRFILYFKYLVSKWWLVTLFAIVGAFLGILKAYLEKPIYKSHLTFALENAGSGFGGALSIAAEFGFNIGSSKGIFDGENITSLISSRRIVEESLLSVDTLNGKAITMADYYRIIIRDSTKERKNNTEKDRRLRSVSYPVGLTRSNFTYLQDSILFAIYNEFIKSGNLVVAKPDKRMNIYEIAVKSPDERFTKILTSKIIQQTSILYTELRSKRSRETLKILEERVAQIKGSLNSAITERAVVQDVDLNPAFQQAQAVLQKKQVDISAYGGAYGELFKNLEMARYQYLNNIPLLQIIDDAEYPMEKIKWGKFKTGIIFMFIFSLLAVIILITFKFVKSILFLENQQ